MPAISIFLNPHAWVATYADYLYAFALTRINDEELARDLVQETFLAALEKLHTFEERSTERTWLTAILKNKIVDVYRKKAAAHNGGDVVPGNYDDYFEGPDGHFQAAQKPKMFGLETMDPVMNKEFATILQLCLRRLPALWLAVFSMKHMDDAATDDICAQLHISPSNFWVITHRAKLQLRACLQKNWV